MERFKLVMKKKFIITYILFVVCFFVPSSAYAYLDPGTGNALVYVVLSLLGAFFYFIKGFFYRTFNKSDPEKEEKYSLLNCDNIFIISEGKSYWNVFKPIVEKLIEKKQHFSYYTMDRRDPCLILDSEFMDNRFIGEGNKAYVKIGNLKANVVLVTTPNIGTKGYPVPRSKRIRKLVYMPHSFGDIAFLHRGALDNYDVFMLTGDFQIQDVRKIEKVRNLPGKELWPAGLPFFDRLLEKNNQNILLHDSQVCPLSKSDVTVLLAPSWGKKSFLNYFGSDFISVLASKGFNLILRPHPQSMKVEKKLIERIKQDLKHYNNVLWDFEQDITHSFETADVLISEVSGVRFEFALAYHKPFITLLVPIPEEVLQNFEIADLGTSWVEDAMQAIGCGYTLKEDEVDCLDEIIMKVLRNNCSEKIIDFKNKNIYNLGHSAEVIADYLIETNNRIQNDVKRDTV